MTRLSSRVFRAILFAGLPFVLACSGFAARIDIEGEKQTACSPKPEINAQFNKTLSGGKELSLREKEPFKLSYDFEVATPGKYTLYAKEYFRNLASPIRWRVDEGPWTLVKQSWGLTMNEMIASQTINEWGVATLAPGRRKLEIESVRPFWRHERTRGEAAHNSDAVTAPGEDFAIVLDKLIFSTEPIPAVREWAAILKDNGVYEAPDSVKSDSPESPWLHSWELDDFSESVLDLINPRKPIGKGPEDYIKRDGENFVDAEGRPLRMWGMSVPTAPNKADAEYYAKRARRLGINVARFHSLDGDLCDMHAGRNYVLDPERLDRMEYFIHCLREEGIYSMLDVLYNWQTPMSGPADGLPEGTVVGSRVRIPFYYDARLQQLNRDLIAQILTHPNPYTGLRNGEDPAISFFQVVNENSVFFGNTLGLGEHFVSQIRAQFNDWLVKRHGDRAKLAAVWGEGLEADEDPAKGTVKILGMGALANARNNPKIHARVADECRFHFDKQVAFYNGVKDYVQKELGFKHILFHGCGWWGQGWLDTLDTAANLPGMDFFDQHAYGPVRSGVLAPLGAPDERVKNFSMIERFAAKAPEGYPWIASEWNNGFGLDGPMLLACYGAMQGWDGLFQYRMNGFDGARTAGRTAQPDIYMQYPLAALAFRHGRVRESEVFWRHVIPDERLFDCTHTEAPNNRPEVGLAAAIGRCVAAFGAGEHKKPDLSKHVREDGAVIESTTGELRYDKRGGALHILAPGMRGIVGTAVEGELDLGAIRLNLKPGELSVVVASLDDKPVSESSRLFMHAMASDERPAGVRESNFVEPFLIRTIVGEIVFDRPIKEVHALDINGKRKASVKLNAAKTGFQIDNSHQAVWFEITR
jgi:hypothetical protein